MCFWQCVIGSASVQKIPIPVDQEDDVESSRVGSKGDIATSSKLGSNTTTPPAVPGCPSPSGSTSSAHMDAVPGDARDGSLGEMESPTVSLTFGTAMEEEVLSTKTTAQANLKDKDHHDEDHEMKGASAAAEEEAPLGPPSSAPPQDNVGPLAFLRLLLHCPP